MNSDRKNEKKGWYLGWCGGFCWVLLMAVISFVQGEILQGLVGSVLALVAGSMILALSPWRHPTQYYWKLMLPLYLLLFLSLAWWIWAYGGIANLGLSPWSLFLLLPILLPLYLGRNRRWEDGEPKK